MAWSDLVEIVRLIGVGFGFVVVALLCMVGIILSCLSLFGTWVVVVATVLAALLSGTDFPGVWTIVGFVVVSGLAEGFEAIAGAWGVTRRGGSALAGFAALVGGLLGLVLGSAIPVPIVGTFVGMLVGGFALVFVVERLRLRQSGQAAHIAWGAVLGRIFVIFFKVIATLGMTAYLFLGLLFNR